MKKLILITGLVIYVLMILIGVAAMAQKPEPPTVHVHLIKNINGKITVKDSSFKPDPAKMRGMMMARHHKMNKDSGMANHKRREDRAAKGENGGRKGMHGGRFKNVDSIAVLTRLTLHGDSLTRDTRRIVYYKARPEQKNAKTADTVININTTIRKGMKGKDVPDFFDRPGMMNYNGRPNPKGMGINDPNNPNTLAVTGLNVYPNPSNGQFRVSFTLPDNSAADLKITDMDGKTVWEEHNPAGNTSYDKNIDLSARQKGVYILEINQNNKSRLKKLVMN